ncbi:hypothetical protein COTS27_00964 [Spirochaetota bacterium]|nr:hypothetical protein COTS27_00964 [Spirochaetota bacterium]
MYYRRKLLLAILEQCKGKSLPKLNFQKILFLISQKQTHPSYQFVPYKYGCYSFQADEDLRILSTHYNLVINKDTTSSNNKSWQLAPSLNKGRNNYEHSLTPSDRAAVTHIFKEFAVFNSNLLVDYTYENAPYYAINTQRKISRDQKRLIDQERKKITHQNKKVLFSIGYEGVSIDAYLNNLIENNIALLVDVRNNPWSRKYDFTKNKLMAYCEKLGIAYIHIPALGIASADRKGLPTVQAYQKLFKKYEKNLPKRTEALTDLKYQLDKHNRIALTCFEKEPTHCHRHVLTTYFNTTHNITVMHL